MNTLMKDNIKEFYKRNKLSTVRIVESAMIQLEQNIKDEDKYLTLDSYEIREMAKTLLIKLIKKYE